ncbi:ATP-dependent DNA helicase DinG [Marinobacterium sediminicola]|uniref:ATP-dependent DNA helicase DinG n=1 Tax=Marinobacterium sediminicola TaxID=518898 RepID=A0ABY1RVM0_9GAMM|nr:ATP-dependent DNA helicase DinG [Marinobacterium sediminicola]ULG70607.1 ATP-dependent DNA helicase DinG [Marinobacterium sediminicola]SMR68890.1 ATP-dependent DNA helicase DinG [Marinobacterium sediminicola]
MLSDDQKREIQEAYSRFLKSRGLKARPAQKQMVAAVARTLAKADSAAAQAEAGPVVGVVEAGTGTGKTIAYLLAAIPLARAKECRLVLSTATVALQEQLINKDLPEVEEHAGLAMKYRLAKGRGRYLCLNKVESLLEQQGLLGQMALYEDEAAQQLEPEVLNRYQSLMDEYAVGRWDGDRDALSEEVDDQIWQPLTSDHMQCSNRRCLNFSACPFYRARDRLEEADVIVANHDLVLADLALGGGAILPEPEKTIYIFDEGHHLADKASGHFAFGARLESSRRMLRSAQKQLAQLLQDTGSAVQLTGPVERLQRPFEDMNIGLEQLELLLRPMMNEHSKDRYRFPGGKLPHPLIEPSAMLAQAADRAQQHLEQIVDVLKEALEGSVADIPRAAAERWFPQLGTLWGRVQHIAWLAHSYAREDVEGKSPTARWINRHETPAGDDLELRSAPVSAADTLSDHLWRVCHAAVLTSATLTALGRFDQLFASLGLPADTDAIRLDSPFDYANNGVLEVPLMKTDPGQPDAHTDEVLELLERELQSVKAGLVLFSSWRQMRSVLERLDESIKNSVLAQGEYSKQETLRRHRERIDGGDPSIIFGLASFAEGVDLPGNYLTDVFITKLPFSVPDDPVDATMAEWIEARGGNAFTDWTVPAASMRLTQAVGRLLRTEQDRGRVVLLDRRVVTRRYGRQLLDSLPPFRREINR